MYNYCYYLHQVKEEIRKVSGGDLRKAITYLQSAARLKKDQPIEKQDIFDIAGVSNLPAES